MNGQGKGRARVEIELPVEFPGEGRMGQGRTADLGMGGCYIESGQPATIGSRILFRMQLPTGRWLMMAGEVTHAREGSGFGVRFAGLPEMSRRALEHFIAHMRGE